MTITDTRARRTAPARRADGLENTTIGQGVRQNPPNKREPQGEEQPGPLAFAGRMAEAFRVRAECLSEKYLAIPDRPSPDAEDREEDPTNARAAVSHLAHALGGSAAPLYLGLALLTCWVMLGILAPGVAFAQPTGGSDGGAIQGAIDNARNWLSTIMVSLGGLGMIASIAVKAVARTNENMHHAAHMGMTGSGIALVAGLLINDIISLLQSFAGG